MAFLIVILIAVLWVALLEVVIIAGVWWLQRRDEAAGTCTCPACGVSLE